MFSLNIFSYLQNSNIEVGILMDCLDIQKLRRDSVQVFQRIVEISSFCSRKRIQ